MGLISKRFANVDKLEQCAVDDAARLTIGANGPHVALVQQALIDLGESVGPLGADGDYGSGTAAGVVSYKTARSILDAQGQINGVVGKKTITTLDAEIHAFDGPEPPPPPGVLKTVTFWINAFIPDPSESEFVLPAPGAATGLSMIVAPPNRMFLGDNRRFSDDPNAPARIHSMAVIADLDKETPTLQSATHVIGESVEIDAAGNAIGRATAPNDRCRFLNLRGNTSVDPNGGVIVDDPSPRMVQLDYEAAANLPLLAAAPDIDLLGVLRIDRDNNRIRFKGGVDDFPAFEAYAAVNGGAAMTLFRLKPVFPLGLVGDVKRNVDANVGFAVF
jgi:peptidoglycan hydrolase-like protein with peptidoglycan-binding domain